MKIKFRILKELVSIITKNKIKTINLDFSPLLKEFYDGICNNTLKSDLDAAQHFYNADEKSRQYRELRTRLYDRLSTAILLIDVNSPRFNDMQKAFYNCHKNFAITKNIIGRGGRNSGILLARKTLTQAQKYKHTNIIFDLSCLLKEHYSITESNEREYTKYNKIAQNSLKLLDAEFQAKSIYENLVRFHLKKYRTKIEDIVNDSDVQEIYRNAIQFDWDKLYILYYQIQVSIHSEKGDHRKVTEICEEAIDFFENGRIIGDSILLFFYQNTLPYYMNSKQYEKAERVFKISMGKIVEGSNNWFVVQMQYFKFLIYKEDYKEAYEKIDEVVNYPTFKVLSGERKQLLLIYEAYANYLVEIGRILTEKKQLFRLAKFLNEVPTFSTDKRGMNIPILVIQVLFLIKRKEYEKARNRIDNLQKYGAKYIRINENFRSNCFIKMLSQIANGNFNKIATIRKSKKYIEKLKTVPLERANQSHEIEIIPYDVLWGVVIENLDNKIH